MTYNEILKFWFEEINSRSQWQKDSEFDNQIRDGFLDYHEAARKCELMNWRSVAVGRLAEIIILDQFSRNIYRDTANAFASDSLALALSQEAIANDVAMELPPKQRVFLYMPFMHSESSIIHEQAIELFSEPGMEANLDFEKRHKEIIDRFGRYPHRNSILGRESTLEETEFLKQPGSSF